MMIASATAWLANEIADASRWLSRSITVENSTRPTTAIAVNSATAIAACSRPITGSRNEIRWTMNPTCATAPARTRSIPSGMRRRAAPARVSAMRTALPRLPRSVAMTARPGGRPTKIRMTGIISTSIAIAAAIMAPETRNGRSPPPARHADDAAEARAVQREADRHAALLVEPETERIGDDAEAGAGPPNASSALAA